MPVTDATLQTAAADRAASDDRIDQLTRDLVSAWAARQAGQRNQLAAALASLTAGLAAWPTRAQITMSFSLQVTLAGLRQSYARLTAQAETLMATSINAAARRTAASQAAVITSQLPSGVSLTGSAGVVPEAALADIIRRTVASGSASLRLLPGAVDRGLRAEIVRGGRGADLQSAIAQLLDGAEQHSSAALARALLITRTALADTERAAARAAHDAAADVLAGWRWWSVLSTDTCPSCWALHGTVYPLSEPGPLDHPAGRCRRMPVVRPWAELGIPGPEPPDTFPDARARFAALPRADQLRIMGPGRLHLLDTGQVAWADLARRRDNPGWRPSYVVVPLRDLT